MTTKVVATGKTFKEMLKDGGGTQWDPEAVKAFLRVARRKVSALWL